MNNFTVDTNDIAILDSIEKGTTVPNYSQLPTTGVSYSGYIDIYRTKRAPGDSDLINEYKRIAFACSNLNANAVATALSSIKLYVRTRKGEKKARLNTRRLNSRQYQKLCQNKVISKYTKDFLEIEEVVEHPVLTLLQKVNSFPGINGFSNWVFTQLYQEVIGKAYWYVKEDPILNIPSELWILPSQYMRPIKDSTDTRIIDYYEYCGGKLIQQNYSVDEIIPFLMPSLINPFTTGLSPLRASFEANEVSNKLIAHEDSFLDNEARPDVIISPGKESSMGEDEAKIMERKFSKRFSRGNIGRPFVTEEEITVTPLNFNPRDLARLEIHKWGKTEICNAYGVPLALLEAVQINRATLEAAREQHAHDAILPRVNRITGILNEDILPRYDDTDRLFLCCEDVVPELREILLQEAVQLKNAGITTANEVREWYNLPPHAEGDELQSINDGKEDRQAERDSGTSDK